MLIRKAPAKINLSLRVLGRRKDGYHEIDSIFLPLELCDRLEIQVQEAGRAEVDCVCPGHPDLDGPSNLVARAAQAYLREAALAARVSITLRKEIWTAAGLGGGSSDAAACLRALQQRLGALPSQRLMELARELGADVPFFLNPCPARVQGMGHDMAPLDSNSSSSLLNLVLVNPGVRLSTAEVYGALGLRPGQSLHQPGADPVAVPWDPPALGTWAINHLEAAAAQLCPEIGLIKKMLDENGALLAMMTGSGPTIFGVFEGFEDCLRVVRTLRQNTGYAALATRTQ